MKNGDSYLNRISALDEKMRNICFLQACIIGEVEKIKLLLENKNLNINIYFKDINGNDGFKWALIYKHVEIIKVLLHYDYKISKKNLNFITKRNMHFNGEFEDIMKIINLKNLNTSLNKNLKIQTNKSKISKI